MLKLTRALIHRADQVHQGLSQLPLMEGLIQPENSFHGRFTPSMLIGLFCLMDKETVHELNRLSQKQTHTDTFWENYKVEIEECKACLRLLHPSEIVSLFLGIERIVMNSGSGQHFKTWREAWQICLVSWLAKHERAHRVKEHLSSLFPLGTLQTKVWGNQELDQKSFAHIWVDYFSSYLVGRGALTRQIVLSFQRCQKAPWSRLAYHIQSQLQAFIQTEASNELRHLGTTLTLKAESQALYITILHFIQRLMLQHNTNAHIDVNANPILKNVVEGTELATLYKQMPARSLRLRFLRECKRILSECHTLPACIMIEQAEVLTDDELELWADMLSLYRQLDHPIILLLFTQSKAVSKSSSEQVNNRLDDQK